jgi:hypothetical protein
VAEINAKLYDSPVEISNRFHATLDVTKQKMGELAGATGSATMGITALFGGFNTLFDGAVKYQTAMDANTVANARWLLDLLGFGQAAVTASNAVSVLAAEQVAEATAAQKHQKGIEDATSALKLYDVDVTKASAALQAATVADVKAIEDRAKEEVAAIQLALDARRKAAEEQGNFAQAAADAAAKILLVQQKSADDQLAIIKANEEKITKALLDASAARAKLGKSDVDSQRLVDADILANRTKSVSDQIAVYQKLYDSLLGQAQKSIANVNALDAERLAFNKDIADKILALKQQDLDGTEKYQLAIRTVEEDSSKARAALAAGDSKLAKTYTDDAIKAVMGIGAVVTEEGQVVISKYDAQQIKIAALKKIQDEFGGALKEQGNQAEIGSKKTLEQLATVKEVLDGLLKTQDDLRAKAEKAIVLNIDRDIQGLDAAKIALDELTKDRTVKITVDYSNAPGAPTLAPVGVPFSGGGPVWRQYAQMLASGGPVFNRPNWSKVPGSGSGDTVPAMLQEGSFVVRKAASQKYGDSFMAQLAQGFAAGGQASVTKDNAASIYQYAKFILPYLRHPIFEESRRVIGDEIVLAEKNGLGNFSLLAELLKSVEFAANNFHLIDFYGKTAISGGAFQTKDLPDFEEWMASRPQPRSRKLATGGPVGEVPAWVTPGEWIIPPKTAAMLGGGFLNALNRGDWLTPPRIPSFATGGPVGNVPALASGGPVSGFGGINITIHATGADFSDTSAVRRMLVPVMRDIQRRSTGV